MYCAWKANAVGRGAKSVCEFLEKNYTDEVTETDYLIIKLVIKALLEVVPTEQVIQLWEEWVHCTLDEELAE